MDKATIRKQESLRRKQLSESDVMMLSCKLLHQFSKINFSRVETLHIFLPIAEKNEPDTFMMIRWLKEAHPGIKIVVPKADFTTNLMTHHSYEGEEYLQKNLYNILEPAQEEIHEGDINMVIIPLLAFDNRGYRVGYGKGFYDRFLHGKAIVKIGLSFFESVDTIDDIHENDVRLDCCITPERIITFK